jgi:DEAD/DEAH box helicase domain-containing protein
VGQDDPINQYLMRHPDFLFDNSCESALINPGNSYIIKSHLLAAAWEHPLNRADIPIFGEWFESELAELEEQDLLRKKRGRWYISPQLASPTEGINIRSISRQNYTLVDTNSGATLETVDESIALLQIHPDAIYLHQGDSYLVTELDIPSRTAFVKQVDVNYYTQPKDLTDLRLIRELTSCRAGHTNVHLGEVEVTLRVLGYKKKRQFSEEIIGEVALNLPSWRFSTIALWFDLPVQLMRQVENKGLDLAGGLHALEHASISILPLLALCDRNDIGGVSSPLHADTGQGAVFIYDAYPGGVGISEQGYRQIKELWKLTHKTIAECPCTAGCPSCIQSPKCGNNNQPLDKKAALELCWELLR